MHIEIIPCQTSMKKNDNVHRILNYSAAQVYAIDIILPSVIVDE